MKPRTVVVTFKRSTKGTHVYVNDDIGVQWYFPKAMFEGEAPESISVKLEAVVAGKRAAKKGAAAVEPAEG